MSEPAGLNTLCVHAAHAPEAATGAVAAPIHLSTTFERDADGEYPRGYRYSREGTPNRTALEACLAQLEGGVGAAAFASGLAANMAVLELLAAGDRLIASQEGYYGSLRQFSVFAERRGARIEFVDLADAARVEAVLKGGTARPRLLWIETPTNPLLNVVDLPALVELGHRAGALVVCDNTFATPVCQRPFESGVDLIIHSGTKYLGGHSDVLAGVVAVREDAALLGRLQEWQRMAGAALAPFDCWLLRRSLATLALRVRAQCAGAAKVAAFLARHPAVERVFYPGLREHPGHTIALRQMRGGFGGMLSVCVAGGREAALRVAARTRLFTRATSLGGVESLIEHRASIEGPGTRAPENLLRLSVGIEEPEDLIADLTQALG
ncbi:MAG: aminotransferase class V-fold PLP-dependent enzyme [Gammaproteobacteria bacterium]|nr:aminotransferase class V-fold PLP-dependent enzyme [Gammaproteobacteria bacterium]MBV8404828.1 aminotransferase class V-fold PLP-dependent enzyme [Gammaproteobacteria bacterium]